MRQPKDEYEKYRYVEVIREYDACECNYLKDVGDAEHGTATMLVSDGWHKGDASDDTEEKGGADETDFCLRSAKDV